MGLLKSEKSLGEMEEEHEALKEKRSILEEKVAIKRLEEKMGKGSWRFFSSNGKRSGLSLSSIRSWLREH